VNIPEGLFYTKEHEWVKTKNGIATIGVTEYAVNQLGDIVFVELAKTGEVLKQFESFGVVESVKTVSDLYAPVSGEVIERNPALLQDFDGEENPDFHPEYINEDPYGKGWLLKIRSSDEEELKNLMTAEQYKDFCK